jgi:hypothetical protein
MRRRNRIDRAGACAAIALGLAGCAADPQAPSRDDLRTSIVELGESPGFDPSRYTVHNDPSYLGGRLTPQNRPLVVRREAEPGRGHGAFTDAVLPTQLVLVGEVASPVVDGHVVQASDVDLDTSTRIAVVAYGTAGPAHAGAVQVIDFADAAHPRLVSEILFHGADVHAVVRVGSYYYAGVARDATDTPAAVEELRTFSGGVFPTGLRRQLPSFAVTDLAAVGNDVMATCGDRDGGLAHLVRPVLQLSSFAPANDARGVAFGPAGEVRVVSGGAAPDLSRFATPGLALLAKAPVDGLRYAQTKGTIEVVGSWSYVGAGDGGFQVRDADGALLDQVANPASAQVAPELAVTNAVSVRGNLAFLACGALGVRVVDLGRWNPAAPAGTTAGLVVVGTIEFPDGVSSNMVKARSTILVVAAGNGGVKLVRMTDVPPS